MILVQPTYFSPIIQYAAIVRSKNILFEFEDNFQKQTYRNRCYISGANGKQLLNIPIKHNKKEDKTKTKDILIDYETSQWHQTHLKSLQAAYRSSPFYEYYEDDIKVIFSKKHKYLIDLNIDTHNFVMEMLQESIPYTKTNEFEFDTSISDHRDLANAKRELSVNFPSYIQMFDEKHPFSENLSILDLLFMEGPASYKYLENIVT
tara:strand:- start:7675 stop:8289 length:615 start_codon:yes stop_codon:yes gene_type:complete